MNWGKYKYYYIALLVTILLVVIAIVYFIVKKTRKETTRKGGGGMVNNWGNDENFFTNSDGKNLYELGKKVGITMSRNKGLGGAFSKDIYESNKENPKVSWAVYDISNEKLLASSKNASTNVYGASVPKICVASATFDKNGGKLPTDSDYEKVIKLLVKSDNEVWTYLQDLAGGKDAVNNWSKKMGYTMQPARGGGNNSNAIDMCKFFNDVCRNNFKGAENIFKISSSCQTSAGRSKKCMPKDVFMGGKTGTYQDSNNDCCWLQKGDKFYSICVLTQLGGNGSNVIAQIFRGLYNDYIE